MSFYFLYGAFFLKWFNFDVFLSMGVSSRIFSSLFVSHFKYWCARAAGAFRVLKNNVFSIFFNIFDGCLKNNQCIWKKWLYFITGPAKFNKERRLLSKWQLFSSNQSKATFAWRWQEQDLQYIITEESHPQKMMATLIRRLPDKETNNMRKKR